ncbi:MAG TPA: isochorismatase family cysteine hydrolase [Gemmatimonadaceae bacterium]|nr:isochorismatase family cysteine hydrolase [Gemmatimonadaceae bacterium]
MASRTIFWDVDTQFDFMDPSGKLYVPDAELIKPKLKRLTDYAHERGIRIVASADDHEPGHRELSAAPDFHDTFPEHCMRGTPGAAKIPETALSAPVIVEPSPTPREELARLLRTRDGDVLIRKHWFDVFTNPNADVVVDTLAPTDVVVYGVALDVCNRYAIEGLLARGVPHVHAVTDATKPIHAHTVNALLESWRKSGVRLVTTEQVVTAGAGC